MLRKIKYVDSADPLYEDIFYLLQTLGTGSFSGNNEHYLWNVIHDVVTLPDGEYEAFLNFTKTIRSLLTAGKERVYRHLICDVASKDSALLREVEEIRATMSETFKTPVIHLIYDIVRLPKHLYRNFLDMLEELRNHETGDQKNG